MLRLVSRGQTLGSDRAREARTDQGSGDLTLH